MKQKSISNKLIQMLSPAAFAKVAVDLQPIQLPLGIKLVEPKRICPQVVFPNTGVASVIATMSQVRQEVGLFGFEGMSPTSAILSQAYSSNLVVMQVAGEGCCIDAGRLRELFNTDAEIRELLLAYAESFTVQLSHTSVANVQCNVSDRLARWLMMMQDRMSGDQLSLTHEEIAMTLGVMRVSVTLALRDLEVEGFISTGHRNIKIDDRAGLLTKVGHFYGGPEREYAHIMAARIQS